MRPRRFLRRRFLNTRGFHAGAYVLAECEVDSYRHAGEPASSWVSASLTLADCARIAVLDFDVQNEAQARNALYKAHLLRDTVNAFTDALEESVHTWREAAAAEGPESRRHQS